MRPNPRLAVSSRERAPRVFSECTLCFRCNSYCPEGLRPYDLIIQRIADQEKRKKRVPAVIPYLLNGMPPPTFFHDLYNGLSFSEKVILEHWSKTPPKSREILWVGCIGRLFCHDIENSGVLKSLPKFGPPDLCCGELHYRMGMWDAYADITEKTLKRFDELDIERMVCYCGSCYHYLSNVLPKVYGKELPFKMISLYQWLWEKVESGELEIKQPIDLKAAIHESCYVSELGPEFWEPLRKLYKAAGVDLVELEHNRDCALSCGAASFARDFNPVKTMLRGQRKKYREVKNSGVNDVALNCPGCYITMGFTSWLWRKKLHYMPEEILRALGDDISTPISKRMPMVLKTIIRRTPLAFKSVDARLPRIQP